MGKDGGRPHKKAGSKCGLYRLTPTDLYLLSPRLGGWMNELEKENNDERTL